MRCRRCEAPMIETRKESSSTCIQTWFSCSTCDTVKLNTLPRQQDDTVLEGQLDADNQPDYTVADDIGIAQGLG